MHELALGQSIVSQVVSLAKREQVRSVSRVRVAVGDAVGVDSDSLSFGFGIAAEGTLADGAVLEIDHIPLRCRCATCRARFQPRIAHAPCARCGSRHVDVLSGRELRVDSFDAEP
jgi:hydrogenase nickel incorporation protein HypA/HybF